MKYTPTDTPTNTHTHNPYPPQHTHTNTPTTPHLELLHEGRQRRVRGKLERQQPPARVERHSKSGPVGDVLQRLVGARVDVGLVDLCCFVVCL